jgi:hypothetical protein
MYLACSQTETQICLEQLRLTATHNDQSKPSLLAGPGVSWNSFTHLPPTMTNQRDPGDGEAYLSTPPKNISKVTGQLLPNMCSAPKYAEPGPLKGTSPAKWLMLSASLGVGKFAVCRQVQYPPTWCFFVALTAM